MRLALSEHIRSVDRAAEGELSLSTAVLIGRSARAIGRVLRARASSGRVCILVGGGHNGADGLALACDLLKDYTVTVILATEGERASACQELLSSYLEQGGAVVSLSDAPSVIRAADVLVDAIYGTGFHGTLPPSLCALSRMADEGRALRIAVDLPLGVCADTAEVTDGVLRADITVALCAPKPAHVSYPARAYVGEVILDTIDLSAAFLSSHIPPAYRLTDREEARRLLPVRPSDGHKGTFGRVLLIVGSETYRGAAHLATEAALRSGVGYVSVASAPTVVSSLLSRYPEAIYHTVPPISESCADDISALCRLSATADATLIGCGLGTSAALAHLCCSLLSAEGGPLILDADALNSLATLEEEGREAIRTAKRSVILTPHPTELARLCCRTTDKIQAHRLTVAKETAADLGVTLVLKGAGTVITDGESVYINSTGSSALAKAGSGDVLAGCITALAATGHPLECAALGVYLHGRAGDRLAERLSELSVIPSDLPMSIGEAVRELM